MAAKILIEECVGETRAAAFDLSGRPFSLFLDRSHERAARATLGNVYAGRLKKHTREQGGGFAELDIGEEVFLRTAEISEITEGASLFVKIEAEARRGKLARGRLAPAPAPELATLDQWIQGLPDGQTLAVEKRLPGDSDTAAAFDEAVQQRVTLPGGGAIEITETPALIAIDIDTSGRNDAGRAYERALAVNIAAAQEAARQLCLRSFGGLAVIDCVAPLRRETSERIKHALLTTFRTCTTRKVEALKPSPFGLLEVSSAWRHRPLAHVLFDSAGELTPYSALHEHVRMFESHLVQHRARSFVFSVPPAVHAVFLAELEQFTGELSARYGARFEFAVSESDNWEVEEK